MTHITWIARRSGGPTDLAFWVVAYIGTVSQLKWRDSDRYCDGWTDWSIWLMCGLTGEVLHIYTFIITKNCLYNVGPLKPHFHIK